MNPMSLKPNAFKKRPGPLLMIIMDGVGESSQIEGNAVTNAYTPTLNRLKKNTVHTYLNAHGTYVGLPADTDMGNSEVGHNAFGAGRVVDQGAKLINRALEDRSIFQTELWREITANCISQSSSLHFIGLLSDGNVHSHTHQLYTILREAAQVGIKKVRLHVLHDGRDVDPFSEPKYILETEKILHEINQTQGMDYRIASGGGRMITTMDRYEADWQIVKRGWDAHVLGDARRFRSSEEAVRTFRSENPDIQDQFLPAYVIEEDSQPVGTIKDGDAVIFFNFRGDRAIEITKAFEESDFHAFDRQRVPKVIYAGMMEYDGDFRIPKKYLVPPPSIRETISEYLVGSGVHQFAISETQKYGHVTYFWNGNRSGYIDPSYETYTEIPSDKIPFEQRPWMKAAEITDETIRQMNDKTFRFGRINLANGDMVGHTGNYQAAIVAVSAVDLCIQRLLAEVERLKGVAFITADHGNADTMYTVKDGKKSIVSSHTLNPVLFSIFDPMYENDYLINPNLKAPGLSNVAATIAFFLGFQAPELYDPALVI